ncbi:MAG: hypothetical protein R2704_09245 [Microthrixaceae bacterium]
MTMPSSSIIVKVAPEADLSAGGGHAHEFAGVRARHDPAVGVTRPVDDHLAGQGEVGEGDGHHGGASRTGPGPIPNRLTKRHALWRRR